VNGGGIYREIRRSEARDCLKADLLDTLVEFFESRRRWVQEEEDRSSAVCALLLEMRRVMMALSAMYPEFADTVAKIDAGCDKLLADLRGSLLEDFLSPTTPAEELAGIAETLSEIIAAGKWDSWSFDFDLEVERRCTSPSIVPLKAS
jgi:hypothetical protein